MARYLVLLKFNSQQNAYNFVQNPYNSAVLGATQADVTSGYIGPSGPSTGIGQPSSAPSSGYSYVDIYVSSPNQIPTGYYNGPNKPSATQLIVNLENMTPVYVSPNIDPNSITLKEGDNTIINNGIPAPDWTPRDPTLDSPIEFKPIYYPGQDLNEVYKQYLRLISDIPSDPNILRDPAIPDIIPDPLAPYNDSPISPPKPLDPRFFPDPGIENPMDLPPWADPYIYKREPSQPVIQKISDEPPVELPEILVEPEAPPLGPPIEIPTVPYPPGFEAEPEFDPNQPITPKFDDSPVTVPPIRDWEVPVDPMPFFPIPKPPVIPTQGPSGGGQVSIPVFVAAQEAGFNNNTTLQTQNFAAWYSRDGLSWKQAVTPVDGLTNTDVSTFSYNQGMIMLTGVYGAQVSAWAMYTFDGVAWQTATIRSNGDTIPSVTYNASTGVWTITIFPGLGGPTVFVRVQNPFFLQSALTGISINQPTSDPAFSSVANSNPSPIALPSGFTAVRDGAFVGDGIWRFSYTSTPITAAITGSGSGWPNATWVDTEVWPGQDGNIIIGAHPLVLFWGQMGGKGTFV